MGEIREGSFYPLENGIGDLDLDDLAERMCFERLQTELFIELIKQLEITIWWDENRSSPRLKIEVFWFDCHVSGANLLDLLKLPFERDVDEIGLENEIEALNALKTKIDAAIELRRGGDEA